MNRLVTLYLAELKKIFAKKSVWIAMVIGMAFVIVVGMTNYSADGGAYVKHQSEVLQEISGEKMDQEFFDDFKNRVNEQIEINPDIYEKIGAHDPDAVFNNAAGAIGYDALYESIYNVMRNRGDVETVDEESFYKAMRDNLIHDGMELGASNEEIDAWMKIYDEIDKPISYSYALSYTNILDVLFLIGWVLFLNITVALCGVFSDEGTYRTDAMILSSRYGRVPVCISKILAGITVSLFETVVLLGGCFGVMFAFYGTAGWNAMIQNVIPVSPWNITVSDMILIYLLLAATTSILFSLTNLLLSHVTHSSVATMAIHAAMLFAGLFNVPPKMGIIAKLWQLRPTMALYYGTFCNLYRYGRYNNIEISLMIYIGLSIVMMVIVLLTYRKTQIESR